MGSKRVAIASPYPPGHNKAMADYLSSFGFDMVAAEGTNLPFKDLQKQSPQEIYAFASAVAARAKDADTLYLPCPQWQGAQVVEALEHDTGKIVVSYTHANFFCAFRALDIGAPIRGHGKLLASLARA